MLGTTSQPTTRIGIPTTTTKNLDKQIISRYVRSNISKVKSCYENELVATPNLAGTLTVKFEISGDGRVTSSTARGDSGMRSPQVENCVAKVVGAIRFPKTKDGKPINVTYPFTFRPADDTMSGGFGYGTSGFGPGGGGTGIGTIGTGRYGTIGHGSGTGSGYGVGSSRLRSRTAVPTVSIGQPTGAGDTSMTAIVRRYIKRNIMKLQYCYEKELVNKAGLAGTITAKFTIDVDGKVSSSTAKGIATVEDCIAKVIEGIEFPKPIGGQPLHVTYPFTFKPPSP